MGVHMFDCATLPVSGTDSRKPLSPQPRRRSATVTTDGTTPTPTPRPRYAGHRRYSHEKPRKRAFLPPDGKTPSKSVKRLYGAVNASQGHTAKHRTTTDGGTGGITHLHSRRIHARDWQGFTHSVFTNTKPVFTNTIPPMFTHAKQKFTYTILSDNSPCCAYNPGRGGYIV